MDAIGEKQQRWKVRDAWLSVLALIVLQFLLLFWLRFAARSNPTFSHWWAAPLGTGVVYIAQDALWLFAAFWFSRVEAIRDFLEPGGLRRRLTLWGWCGACLAIAIAFIDAYGASRGLTASSRKHHASTYGALSVAWFYFTLSAVMIAPFCEEVMTRGFLYRAFRERYSFVVTTVIIVCFSAYFHWNSVSRSLFTFGCLAALWLLLCTVREKTGSLWDCLVCHAAYNSVAIHLWIPAVAAMVLLLPFVMRPVFHKRPATMLGAPAGDA